MTIICDECGKKTHPGETNGLPNIIGFELQDGKIINICQECLIKMGEKSEQKEGE